jgi:ketosteroid isomerase-like protein
MSQENIELTRRAFETFNRGGVDACVSEGLWSPEIVWDATPSGIPGLGAYRGHEEVKRFFEDDWFKVFPFEEWEVELEEVIDAGGDRVISMSRQHGRGASSGAVAELELAQIGTVRDGQVVRVDNYVDRKKALEAAGLRE